ncbi:MAG: type 1 glutamine amidotransferase [Solirubrobacteraceae bacterium]
MTDQDAPALDFGPDPWHTAPMPPSLLVIQNDPDKSLGRLADGLQSAGARLDVLSPTAELPDVREYDGLIVLPGLANPVDDTVEIRRARDGIEGALEAGLPILGLCLGGQLLAQALGGTVHRSRPELGFGDVEALPAAADDPLLVGAPSRFPIFHAHTFAFSPPSGAEVLLVNDVCVQACRHGEAWAFQCHPEIAGDWVATLAAGLRGRDGQLLPATTGFFHSNGVSAEQLEHDAAAAEPAMQALADGIAGGFAGRLA